jgi:hypothetical protein
VRGSHARGESTLSSDLDLKAVLLGDRAPYWRTWVLGELHVSVSFASGRWLREQLAEPASWSLGFAVEDVAYWAWSTAAATAVLGDPPDMSRPPGDPELEDFVEFCSKAFRATDSISLRMAARCAAEYAVPLLRDLNAPERVHSRAGAMRAALGYATAPGGWRGDLAMSWGLTPVADEELRRAVERLARGTLALLREKGSRVGDGHPDLSQYLDDGTLERHLGLV